MNSNSEIKIIFEDDYLVVINKPAGVVVNNSQTAKGETVQQWFTKRFKIEDSKFKDTEFGQKGGVVHRLDKETSGLLLLAKNADAYFALKKQFLERKVYKMYSSLVHGVIDPVQGVISLPVSRHPKVWGKFTVGTDLSRTAITEWKRVMSYETGVMGKEKYSLLELRPMTGRTHQLRVHLKYLGCPIVSDPLYLNKKQLQADLMWCPRLFLHATKLSFTHPVTGGVMSLVCELPPDLQQVLQKLVH